MVKKPRKNTKWKTHKNAFFSRGGVTIQFLHLFIQVLENRKKNWNGIGDCCNADNPPATNSESNVKQLSYYRSKLLQTMASQSSTAIESFTNLALAQFVNIFDDMCVAKSMTLSTEDGVEVKGDILHRMMYEATTGTEITAKDLNTQTRTSSIKEDIKTTGKEPTPRASHAGIKVNFKDLKKVEKKNNITFPFLPDLVDYVCENTCCQSLKVNGNLFVPCGTNVKGWSPDAEGATDIPICKTCMKQGNREKYGCLMDRVSAHAAGLVYEAPLQEDEGSVNGEEGSKKAKGPKKEVTFATYLAKKGDLGDDAKQRNGRLSEKIGELEGLIQSEFHMSYKFEASHFAIDKTKVRGKKSENGEKKRGRPKKERSASVSSTSSEEESSENVPSVVVDEKNVPEPEMEDEVSSISGSEQEEEEEPAPEPEKAAEEPKPVAKKEKSKKPVKKSVKKPRAKVAAASVSRPKNTQSETISEEGELEVEKNETVETEEVVRKTRKFVVDGKKYFMDVEDNTVYDENDEYVGDYDSETGEVSFVDME